MSKRSFFERLTGSVRLDDEERELSIMRNGRGSSTAAVGAMQESVEEETDGELTVDMYHTPDAIIIKTMAAGVKPEDLDVSISRDSVTVRGHREEAREVSDDDYFHRELYWGSFSRTIALPAEIDIENAEAAEKHGLVILTLPKINKERQTKLRVKSN